MTLSLSERDETKSGDIQLGSNINFGSIIENLFLSRAKRRYAATTELCGVRLSGDI